MQKNEKEGGMIVKLKDDIPTLITVNGRVVKLYSIATGGKGRIRVVADRDIVITCTHFTKNDASALGRLPSGS